MSETAKALDEAIRDHYRTHAAEDGPVIAWALIVATDNHGGTSSEVIWIEKPDGQRGLITTGLISEAHIIATSRDITQNGAGDK